MVANLRWAKGTRRTLLYLSTKLWCFCASEKVKVGDYPVEELDLEDEEI